LPLGPADPEKSTVPPASADRNALPPSDEPKKAVVAPFVVKIQASPADELFSKVKIFLFVILPRPATLWSRNLIIPPLDNKLPSMFVVLLFSKLSVEVAKLYILFGLLLFIIPSPENVPLQSL
jgi:hypothetical protein